MYMFFVASAAWLKTKYQISFFWFCCWHSLASSLFELQQQKNRKDFFFGFWCLVFRFLSPADATKETMVPKHFSEKVSNKFPEWWWLFRISELKNSLTSLWFPRIECVWVLTLLMVKIIWQLRIKETHSPKFQGGMKG